MSKEEISKCKVLEKGTKTRFRTVYQIDNYETHIKGFKNVKNNIEEVDF